MNDTRTTNYTFLLLLPSMQVCHEINAFKESAINITL